MSLVTRCPACSTLFKVVPDQIRIAAGWVRCGHCGVVFDASTHLLPRDASTAPAPVGAPAAETTARAAPLPAAVTSPPMPWGEASAAPPVAADAAAPAPSIAPLPVAAPAVVTPPAEPAPVVPDIPAALAAETDDRQATAWTQPTDLVRDDPAETPSATTPSAEPALDEPAEAPDPEPSDLPPMVDPDPLDLHLAYTSLTEPALLDPLEDGGTALPERPHPDDEPASNVAPLEAPPSFVAAARRRAFWASRPVRALLWLVALLGVLALAGQWVVGQRDWLAARLPQSAPALRALCAPLGCQIRPYRQLDAIVIDASAFNRVAGPEFRFSVSLRNSADWPVASPALELILTDRDNQPLVRRVLTAAELGAPPALAPRGDFSASQGVTVGAPVDAAAVAGYRLTAFYP